MPTPRTGRATTNQVTQSTLLTAYQSVLDEQRVAFEAELAEDKAKFEAEKAEQLAAWKKELARLKEEDTYNFNKEKRDREDALKVELAKRVSDVTDREVKVKERESAIGDAEKTIASLQAIVDNFPTLANKAEATGYAKGAAEAKKEADGEARIVSAQSEAEKQILNSRIEALQATVTTQVGTISNLQEELKSANGRVQEIANNAVTAAGNSKVTVQNAPTGNTR